MSRMTPFKRHILMTHLVQSFDAAQFLSNWAHRARGHQFAPDHMTWLIWLLMGGRGAGKTRTGAEWIREQVAHKGKKRIALVAPTFQDAREVMIEGESGLKNIGYPSERPEYYPRVTGWSGLTARLALSFLVRTRTDCAALNLIVLGPMNFAPGTTRPILCRIYASPCVLGAIRKWWSQRRQNPSPRSNIS